MKKGYLKCLALLMAGVFAMHVEAQTWEAPAVPGADLNTLESTTTVYMYNVEADAFTTYGMDWGTKAVATRLKNGDSNSSTMHSSKVTVSGNTVRIVNAGKGGNVGTNSTSANDVWADFATETWYTYTASTEASNVYILNCNNNNLNLDVAWTYGGPLTTVNGQGYTDWAFIPETSVTDGSYALYKAKKKMYAIYEACSEEGKTTYAEALATALAAYTAADATAATINEASKVLFNSVYGALENSVDASFLFDKADMVGEQNVSSWTSTNGDIAYGNIEIYHKTFLLEQSQVIPDGVYSVVFHSLWRQDGTDAAPNLLLTSGENSASAAIPLMTSINFGVSNGTKGGWSGTIPNDKNSSGQAMAHGSAVAKVNNFSVIGNPLKVSVNQTSTSQWFNWQGFEIIYEGGFYQTYKVTADAAKLLLTRTLPSAVIEAINTNANLTSEATTEELANATSVLTPIVENVDAIETAYVALNSLIEKCEGYATHSTPNTEEALAAFNTVIANAKTVADEATTAEEFTTAYNALESARQTYVMNAVPAEGHPFDLTFKVVNPYFDNGTTGWVSNTGASNNRVENNQTGDITGNFYANWNWSSYVGTIEQTVTNLPNGVYSVTIAAFRDQLIDGASEQDAVYVFGNDQSTLVTATTGTYYTVEDVKVFDGTLRLGIESTVANYRWMGIDNVSIAMTGAISDEEVETLLAAKETLAAAEVLDRVIAKKIGINNILNDAQCAANIEEASALYNDALSDPTSVVAEDINAMIATLWADLDDYTANVLNGEFESVTDGVLDGWTTTTDGEWAKFGVSAYGTNTSVNGVIAPATDILGQAENNTFGYSAGWELTVKIEQEIFLPAGKHILTYDVYNANATTTNTPTNLTCVTVGETSFVSTLASYEAGAWMSDVIEVEMAEACSVTLTIGYTAAAEEGSDGSPKLWIDNVKVYSTNVHRRANAEAGKYGTICLPFNAELPENMLLYSVAGVDSKDAPTTLYLNKETSLQAGVAYIYYSLDANDIMLQKSDVAELLDAPEVSSNGLTGTFVGAIPTTETTFTGEHYYLLSQNKWVKVKSEYAGQVGVKRFRAYLDVQQIADENTGTEVVSYARSMNIGGGGANGIEEILNSLNGGDDLFYTVGGQRVSTPVKGLYIKNGKKIIVK